MNETIDVFGIETNNLKNIDVSLVKHGINLIIGPSGSGKSSLAYDTIASIGQHEIMSMFADDISEPSYKVREYRNMIAAIPIKQLNHNNNMRSTIGTYFGLNRSIAFLYSALLGMSEDFFVLNRESNLCEYCHGAGFIRVLDENRIINYDIPLARNPFKCWNRYKDFYSGIIKAFCDDNRIDSHKSFRQLTSTEKKHILYGESECKYSIKFKKNSSFSRRTTKYYGIMTGIPMIVKYTPSMQFYSEKECENCKGKKYSNEQGKYPLFGLSIGEFMSEPFSDLLGQISKMQKKVTDSSLQFALKNVERFVNKAVELGLEHLFFHRSIPTLSGGELQRLRLVQVFITQLSDLLIVLDEPLTGLSGDEKHSVYNNVIELSKRHTLAVVEHSDIFAKNAKFIVALGEKSGKLGGSIIDADKYLLSQQNLNIKITTRREQYIPISINSKIYRYYGAEIKIAEGNLNLITGKSGVGKSVLLREYFPQYFECYEYVNQKPLLGNKNSFVATILDIFTLITSLFAKKYNKEKGFFSNLTGCEGACPVCAGAGYIDFGSNQYSITRLMCKECDGTGFHKNLRKYKINDISIFDLWGMTIDETINYFEQSEQKIAKTLATASDILLGHLRIGQPTATLSGGENIRIKILKSSKPTTQILGIDEPFKGLSNIEIISLIRYFESLLDSGKTVIVAEHNDEAFPFFFNRLELKDDKGILAGVRF
jgi:excinuclease UvrABC ATPase subunit